MAQQQQRQRGESQEVGGQGTSATSGTTGGGIQRTQAEKGTVPAERKGRGGALSRAEYESPFSMMGRLMDEMDRFFSGVAGEFPSSIRPFGGEVGRGISAAGWSPEIETFQRNNQLVVRADLPGLRAEDVKVEVSGDELVISGERTEDKQETIGGQKYTERHYGSFERRFTLPEGCDPSNIDASFDNGVLEVCLAMPQREEPKTRKVQIKSGRTPSQGQGGSEPVH